MNFFLSFFQFFHCSVCVTFLGLLHEIIIYEIFFCFIAIPILLPSVSTFHPKLGQLISSGQEVIRWGKAIKIDKNRSDRSFDRRSLNRQKKTKRFVFDRRSKIAYHTHQFKILIVYLIIIIVSWMRPLTLCWDLRGSKRFHTIAFKFQIDLNSFLHSSFFPSAKGGKCTGAECAKGWGGKEGVG